MWHARATADGVRIKQNKTTNTNHSNRRRCAHTRPKHGQRERTGVDTGAYCAFVGQRPLWKETVGAAHPLELKRLQTLETAFTGERQEHHGWRLPDTLHLTNRTEPTGGGLESRWMGVPPTLSEAQRNLHSRANLPVISTLNQNYM